MSAGWCISPATWCCWQGSAVTRCMSGTYGGFPADHREPASSGAAPTAGVGAFRAAASTASLGAAGVLPTTFAPALCPLLWSVVLFFPPLPLPPSLLSPTLPAPSGVTISDDSVSAPPPACLRLLRFGGDACGPGRPGWPSSCPFCSRSAASPGRPGPSPTGRAPRGPEGQDSRRVQGGPGVRACACGCPPWSRERAQALSGGGGEVGGGAFR